MTSFIMENLNRMIFTLNESNKMYEEHGELNLFINIFTRFNGDEPLKKELKEKIDRYFKYRWANIKNIAFLTNGDMSMMKRLPLRVQNQIYTKFLFRNLISKFQRYLARLSSADSKRLKSSSQDPDHLESFMTVFFRYMEPI